jgi:hypothetical protein
MKLICLGASALALVAVRPGVTIAAQVVNGPLHSQAWDDAHLGPDGLAKCHAFRALQRQTAKLQQGDKGTLPTEWRAQLQRKLAAAEAMTPKYVTPAKCGVPL